VCVCVWKSFAHCLNAIVDIVVYHKNETSYSIRGTTHPLLEIIKNTSTSTKSTSNGDEHMSELIYSQIRAIYERKKLNTIYHLHRRQRQLNSTIVVIKILFSFSLNKAWASTRLRVYWSLCSFTFLPTLATTTSISTNAPIFLSKSCAALGTSQALQAKAICLLI
jgi:hypothetical protein